MGFLHEGHATLIKRAASRCDRVVVSVFVNPLQFGPSEDLSRYPRSLSNDRLLAGHAGADIVYAPQAKDMYPEGFATKVEVSGLSDRYCGQYRPGHFSGVATVVLKLFNQVPADFAYFGEKDFQQVVIIERMVTDLDLPVKIVRVPTVRSNEGLALSSRNSYLSKEERLIAPQLRAALSAAAQFAGRSGATVASVKAAVRRTLAPSSFKIQYVAIVDETTLKPAVHLGGKRRLLIAAYLGQTRLIDNIPL
jgi:pantoate--beta-alanine ligase